jgi:hypothetical protein
VYEKGMEVDAQFDVASVGELPYVPPADEAMDVAMNANEVSRTAVKRDTAEDEDYQLSDIDEADSGGLIVDSGSPPMVPNLDDPQDIESTDEQLIADSEDIRTQFCVREYDRNLMMEFFVPPQLGRLFTHGKVDDMEVFVSTLESLALTPPQKKRDLIPPGCGKNKEMLDTEKELVREILGRSLAIAAKCTHGGQLPNVEGVLHDVGSRYYRLVRAPWQNRSSNVSSSALGLVVAGSASKDCVGGATPETQELLQEFYSFCYGREEWIGKHRKTIAGARTVMTRLPFGESVSFALALSTLPIWNVDDPASAVSLVKLSLRDKESAFFDWGWPTSRWNGQSSVLEDSHDPTTNISFGNPDCLPPDLLNGGGNQAVLPPSRMLSDRFRSSLLPGGFFMFRIPAASSHRKVVTGSHSSKLATDISPAFPGRKLRLTYSFIDKGTVIFDASTVPFLQGDALMVVCVRPKEVHSQLMAETDRAWNDASQFVEIFRTVKRPLTSEALWLASNDYSLHRFRFSVVPFRMISRDYDAQHFVESFMEHFSSSLASNLPRFMWIRDFCSQLQPSGGPFSMDAFRELIIPGFELLFEYLSFDQMAKRRLLSQTVLKPLLEAISNSDLTVPQKCLYEVLSLLHLTCGSLFEGAWDSCMDFHLVFVLGVWELSGEQDKQLLMPFVMFLCAVLDIARPPFQKRDNVHYQSEQKAHPPWSRISFVSAEDYFIDERKFLHSLLRAGFFRDQQALRALLAQYWADIMKRFVCSLHSASSTLRVRPKSLACEPKHRILEYSRRCELKLDQPLSCPEANIVNECCELLQRTFRNIYVDTGETYVPTAPIPVEAMILHILRGQYSNSSAPGFGPQRLGTQFLSSLPAVDYCIYLVYELLLNHDSTE